MKGKHRPEKQRVVNTHRAIKQTIVLVLAYLMEDGWDGERVTEMYNTINNWSNCMEEHLLSITKVCELIKEKTGDEVVW